MRRRAGIALALFAAACTPTLSAPDSEEHLDAMARAGRHYHHGRMQDAAREFHAAAQAADRRVDRDEARYREAKALARAGEISRAIAILEEVAAVRPVSRRTARALFDAGRLRLRSEDDSERARGWETIARVFREHPDHGLASRALFLWIAERERAEGREAALGEVRALLDSELARRAIGDDLLSIQAQLLLDAGDRAGARGSLERIVVEFPYPTGQRWDDALWRLADLDVEDGEHARAIERLRAMLAVRESTTAPGTYTLPRQPEAAIRVARIYRDGLRDYDAAERAFRAAHDDFPTSLFRDDAMVELAEMWIDRGRRDDGCELLREVLDDFEVGRARRRAARRVRSDCGGGED